MVIFAGVDTVGRRTDVWSFSLDSLGWHRWFPTGTPPVQTDHPFAACDANHQRMLAVRASPYPKAGESVFALSLTGEPVWTELTVQGFGPAQEDPRPNSSENLTGFYDNARDLLVLYRNRLPSDPSDTRAAQIWALYPEDWTVPVLVSLLDARVEGTRVRLVWSVAGVGGALSIERRIEAGPWQILGAASAGADGQLRWEDSGLRPGSSYSYRLRIADGATFRYAGEATVRVPDAALVFAPLANPTASALRFLVRLPSGGRGPARIELFDLTGRQVLDHTIDAASSDAKTVEVTGAGRLRPGLYQARLLLAGRVLAHTRVAILR